MTYSAYKKVLLNVILVQIRLLKILIRLEKFVFAELKSQLDDLDDKLNSIIAQCSHLRLLNMLLYSYYEAITVSFFYKKYYIVLLH